jgi:hypothetical protein
MIRFCFIAALFGTAVFAGLGNGPTVEPVPVVQDGADAASPSARATSRPASPDRVPVPGREAERRDAVRGMTVSCHSWGWEWGTDEMVGTMTQLKQLGVNWIAIHPYAGIRADGSVVMRESWYEDPTWVLRPIAEAHRLGLKIMIKPHIAYWGSPFSWRGEIAFEEQDEWERFFTTYRQWIIRMAELCAEADAFVVGTELGKTVHFETRWRSIIADVRHRTEAPLTYSANWDSYEKVPFWDALDVIGIQGYFPLVTHDRVPSAEELETSWRNLLRRLERYGRSKQRPLVLAELGYNRSPLAAQRPWEYRQGRGAEAEEVQRRCLTAALRALDSSDAVVGAFLWKWFPGESARGNFLMSTPAMRGVIGTHWAEQ